MADNVESEYAPHQDQEEIIYAEGGWGWVVCGAAFMVSFVVFGIHNSFGVIYSKLVEDMKMGEAETGWCSPPPPPTSRTAP